MNLQKHRWMALVAVAAILAGAFLIFSSPSTSQPTSEVAEATGPDASEPSAASPTSNYGAMLLKMIVSVALVCLLAYAILRWGLGRLVGNVQADEHMDVLGRLAVGPNRQILVVRVASRFLVVGSTETEISVLTELSEDEATAFLDPQPTED
jgi:flagellar protein FliO/FliZ